MLVFVFHSREPLGNHCLKKKSNYGFEANHQKLSLKSGEGEEGGNCVSMLFNFVSHVPQKARTRASPGGSLLCSRTRPNAGRVTQRKPKHLVPGMSPSLMSMQEVGKIGRPASPRAKQMSVPFLC